jgi:TorA maturation chaperone TorD
MDALEPSFSLLSRLWLHEPDEDALEETRRLSIFSGVMARADDLGPAYIDLFLLNVYPYGSAFTEPSGELNGPSAWETQERFEQERYRPAELSQVGAPDHVGLCLGFLGHLEAAGRADGDFLRRLVLWLPVCAIAIEREPSAHPFYRALARATREKVLGGLGRSPLPALLPSLEAVEEEDLEAEVGLSEVVRFLLSPARCGFFLSRSRIGELGRAAGIALPFGARFDVARTLLVATGESQRVPRLLELLTEEISLWESAYRDLAREHPVWRPGAGAWLELLEAARRRLEQMRAAVALC